MAEKRDGTFVRRGIADAGRFAYEGLERIFHEKARLGIMTSLLTHPEGLVFNDLKKLCALTDGNLSRHMQALNEANFVAALVSNVERFSTLWTLRRGQDRLRTAAIASNELHPLPLSSRTSRTSSSTLLLVKNDGERGGWSNCVV